LLIERCNQYRIRPDAAAETRQARQRGLTVLIGSGKRLLKGMIARKNGSRGRNLLRALLDELFENARAGVEAGFNLSQRMLPICLADDNVCCALQQRQKSDEEKKQPASETAESKFQR
jgi:hypothetical protein